MQSEWESCALGDAITLKRGYDLPAKQRRPGDVPLVSSSGVTDFHSHAMVRGPGVVTGRYGTIGQVFYVSHDFWPLNTTLYVQDFKGNDKRFISYLLKTIDFHQFSDKAAVPGVNRNHLHAARIWLPPLSDQMRIAAVLQCLDDRIDLLRQTNATLEAIAQALFKSWFIDFDPVRAKAEGREPEGMDAATAALFPSEFEESPLGLIPKGWRIESLGHWLTVLETGRRPKGGVGRFSSGIPSVGAESIVRVGQYDFEKTKYVPTEFFATMKTGVLTSRDVLLYKDGGKPGVFLPRVSMFGDGYPFETCAINEHVFRLRAKEPIGQVFLYFWLWSDAVMHELKHRGGKAAIPGINQSDVKEQRLLIPHPAIAMSFEHATDALVSRIFCNAKSIQSLAALRDTLLPRLISGKLQLPEVRETVEDALS